MRGFVGDSDFRATGDEFLRLFVELGGLHSDERVLDVGCGIGRMARPLAGYLRPPGAYEGFDVVPEAVAWCQRRYADHPHFGFRLADVSNGFYRPEAGSAARDYSFPYPDAGFDFAFATSLFTHLLPEEADRYLAEMARVTRPGGSVFVTFFLLGPEAPQERSAQMSFANDHGDFATASDDVAEAAVAYKEEWLRAKLTDHGLATVDPFCYGTWSGCAEGLSFQDVVVARRSG
jgi:SAM-dependent methyltransferase